MFGEMCAAVATAFGSEQFRAVLGHFCSGITVITGVGEKGEPIGFTCQSFTSVSLDPPLVAVCPSFASNTYRQLRDTGRFCVNILGDDQHDLSNRFATSGVERFVEVDWSSSPHGAPVLDRSIAWIDCELELEHRAGDHFVVIARVLDLGLTHDADVRRPLLYYKGGYHRLQPL